MARPLNPRRAILRDLRKIKALISWLVGQWDVRSTVFVPLVDQQSGSRSWLRPRQPNEYPENDVNEWMRLACAMEELAKAATRIAIDARWHAHEIQARGEVSPDA